MNWKHVSLGEISVNIQTGPFGSQLHQSDYSEKGTPVVMPKDLISGHISEESIARVSDDHVERLSRHKIEVGDILYSRRGDVGRCAFASETEAGWLCGTGCLRVTIDSRKANPKFVFYQLLKADTIGWVEKHAVGSTMLNLNTSILSSVPIDLPSHDKQNHIVGVLSAYDDLIENNQKQIKLLEEAAQRLYKEWFVDLRFPGHETTPIVDGVPDGWTYKPFSEVFDYVRGKSYTSKELSDTTGILMANLKNIRAFGGYNRNAEKRFTGQYKANQMLYAGDIVMGVTDMTQERRLVGHVALVPDLGEKMTFSMDLIKIIPKLTDNLFLYSAMYYGGLSKQISPLANGVNEDIEPDIRKRYEAIAAIYGELKKKRRTVTNVDLMVEINHIISEYVQIEQATDGITLSRQFDISKIDFDLLRREFAKAKKKNLIMKDLQELIRVRLDAMLFNNPDRIKYHERYQEIIEDYNSQQDRANIEKTFDELMDLVQNMDQEERRYVREGFSSDEELSLYDMLFSENLSKQDIQKIKKVAVDLLQKVKSKIAELDHWTDKQETKATIDTLIRDTLWLELPECYDELRISEYRQRIYEYVYTRYKGVA